MPKEMKANITFIKTHTKPSEKIFIVDYENQGIYYNATQTISIFNPGYIELMLRSDATRLSKIVDEKPIKNFTKISDNDPAYIYKADNGIIKLVSRR